MPEEDGKEGDDVIGRMMAMRRMMARRRKWQDVG